MTKQEALQLTKQDLEAMTKKQMVEVYGLFYNAKHIKTTCSKKDLANIVKGAMMDYIRTEDFNRKLMGR
ncbi:MAG: hypothetical protein ACRDDY_16800 [Clostridium sp.]|uniref:hypothetical protein n=1 Tax=Clostridium sp. TaxID=1506 RepID=UPI003EE476CC